jgi:hypothetical protein
MVAVLIYTYYYKYKDERKHLKSLVESNNISGATSIINQTISEHDSYISDNNILNTGDTFTSVDNLSLHHAQDHLNSLEQQQSENKPDGIIQQKNATIRALEE